MPGLTEEPEILRRYALVRAAKDRKARRGLGPDLTVAELDVLVPPVECARHRLRLRDRNPGGPERREDHP